jgi:hypothetical protein
MRSLLFIVFDGLLNRNTASADSMNHYRPVMK